MSNFRRRQLTHLSIDLALGFGSCEPAFALMRLVDSRSVQMLKRTGCQGLMNEQLKMG
ncbi:hypothetical protein [Fibrivirga algicola]|uniref:hypothetical protein n=1 Tax=Fibrivirga algicola TaxID=2950420 RepID=UPI001419D97B|nr:hypothetical protein [Fibrivirga algicola]